jgi:signal peptidase II
LKTFLSLFFIFLLLDQGAKILFLNLRPDLNNFLDLSPVFKFEYLKNSGVALSFFSGHWIVVPLVIVAFVLLIYYFYKNKIFNRYPLLSSLLIAGAVGNIIDRLLRGHVVDFLNIFSWSVVNVADIMITASLVLFLISDFGIFKNKKTGRNQNSL